MGAVAKRRLRNSECLIEIAAEEQLVYAILQRETVCVVRTHSFPLRQ
jgi:hypothetical protein